MPSRGLVAATALAAAAAQVGSASAALPLSVTLNNGVQMPRVNLGTCCGSSPDAGLPSWLDAGGVGIDTAWDYQDQANISRILQARPGLKREDVFILSKVPAGFGNASDCHPDPDIVLRYARENLAQLGTDYLDVLLLHAPCDIGRNPCPDPTTSDQALWRGAQEALRLNLTRAIGVSNYQVKHLTSLNANSSTPVVPALNQCQMSIAHGHDDETIAYCKQTGTVYESYGALKGCPWADNEIANIANTHGKSVAQVCVRWALQLGGALAAGTGDNATAAAGYAHDNLDVFDFALDANEMKYLNEYQA